MHERACLLLGAAIDAEYVSVEAGEGKPGVDGVDANVLNAITLVARLVEVSVWKVRCNACSETMIL